jgi:hypothetical protein
MRRVGATPHAVKALNLIEYALLVAALTAVFAVGRVLV